MPTGAWHWNILVQGTCVHVQKAVENYMDKRGWWRHMSQEQSKHITCSRSDLELWCLFWQHLGSIECLLSCIWSLQFSFFGSVATDVPQEAQSKGLWGTSREKTERQFGRPLWFWCSHRWKSTNLARGCRGLGPRSRHWWLPRPQSTYLCWKHEEHWQRPKGEVAQEEPMAPCLHRGSQLLECLPEGGGEEEVGFPLAPWTSGGVLRGWWEGCFGVYSWTW